MYISCGWPLMCYSNTELHVVGVNVCLADLASFVILVGTLISVLGIGQYKQAHIATDVLFLHKLI